MYTNKIYREARLVAERAHTGQLYDGIFPYSKHLDDVVDVITRDGFSGKYIVAGYLHDSIEDGDLSYKNIKKHFGEEVAEIVFRVTDELGRDREEKKLKTLPKIAGHTDATIIKLADRIANTQHGGKIDMYKKEYPAFKKALYNPTDIVTHVLWQRLDQIMR